MMGTNRPFRTPPLLSNAVFFVCFLNSARSGDAAAAQDQHGVRGAQRGAAEARGEHARGGGEAGGRRDAREGTQRAPPPAPGHAAPGAHLQLLRRASAR